MIILNNYQENRHRGLWRLEIRGDTLFNVCRTNREGTFYYVGPAPTLDNAGVVRFLVSKELEIWLNGGDDPDWLDKITRTDEDRVRLRDGYLILAPEHPELIDALCDKVRPIEWLVSPDSPFLDR